MKDGILFLLTMYFREYYGWAIRLCRKGLPEGFDFNDPEMGDVPESVERYMIASDAILCPIERLGAVGALSWDEVGRLVGIILPDEEDDEPVEEDALEELPF